MKLTIAVLGTTVVANVYAVAMDCRKVGDGGEHESLAAVVRMAWANSQAE